MDGRKCSVCGGPLTAEDMTGICTKNQGCRLALPVAYDIDTGAEIIDERAVEIAVQGTRKVALTVTERKLVIKEMISRQYQFREIADHIGTSPQMLRPLFDELGYELIPRRTSKGAGHESTQIRRRLTPAGEPGKLASTTEQEQDHG
jgi:hypothetical protein